MVSPNLAQSQTSGDILHILPCALGYAYASQTTYSANPIYSREHSWKSFGLRFFR